MPADDAFDVAVVGAGAAGVAAAVTAARAGARVVLIDRSSRPGGVVSQALVHTICGLYLPSSQGRPEFANEGFPRLFTEALRRGGGTGDIAHARNAVFLPIAPDAYTALVAEYCAQTKGLTLLCDCTLVTATLSHDARSSSQLGVRHAGRARTLTAGAVVDCSGDALVAALAGADTLETTSEDLQYPSYIVRLDSVDTSALDRIECARISTAVARACRDGRLPIATESVLLRTGVEAGSVYATINVDKPDPERFDPLDEGALESLVTSLKEAVNTLSDFLIETRPAFTRARLGRTADCLGVRESRRVAGREVISGDDIREARTHEDEICRSSWPIELWTSHKKLHFEPVSAAGSVPLGALQSASHPLLATAGRCLSADREALGALRVIGTAMATGEAAGVNAALAIDGGCRLGEVEAASVRAELRRIVSTS